MIHKLKIDENYLINLLSGKKKSENRINDRDYQLGDFLKFYNSTKRVKPGDEDFYVYFKITHIHSGLGMDFNYISLSVEHVSCEVANNA